MENIRDARRARRARCARHLDAYLGEQSLDIDSIGDEGVAGGVRDDGKGDGGRQVGSSVLSQKLLHHYNNNNDMKQSNSLQIV